MGELFNLGCKKFVQTMRFERTTCTRYTSERKRAVWANYSTSVARNLFRPCALSERRVHGTRASENVRYGRIYSADMQHLLGGRLVQPVLYGESVAVLLAKLRKYHLHL